MVQPALYDGDEILKTHHVPVSVTSSEEDLEIAEITRQKMNEKMNDPVSLIKEVRAMKAVFENMEAEVDQNVIDKKYREIERKNLLLTNENLIANCIAQDVFYTVTDSALTASRFHDLSNAYNVAMTRAVELEAENSKLFENFQNDDHDTMIKDFSKLDIAHLNLQLKHQHLKENIENFKSKSSKDVPEFDAFFELGKWEIIFNVTKTLSVELIPPSQRNNRDVHHHYLNRLRDTLDTLHEIVKEARSKRPSDHSLDYACVYTKRSQELLENVSASCLKARNKRDKVIATTPLTRKKHVTLADPLETSGNNTTNHVKHPAIQKTNVLIIHSTRVNNATKARRSQPKSNKMNDKTLPTNSVLEKKVKDHHRKK
ncbi:hypothetical protein Tco_1400346 [Tanacetum coccineum]